MNAAIKVADFGLSESMEKEYFRQDQASGIKLPLKWMAPESMEYGVFSEKSDVVRKQEQSFQLVLIITSKDSFSGRFVNFMVGLGALSGILYCFYKFSPSNYLAPLTE